MSADSKEFTALTASHLTRLFQIGMRLTRRNGDESQDLVQETLTRAWTNWASCDRSGDVGAWMARILTNVFNSRHRHQKVVDKTAARPDLLGHLYDSGRLEEASDSESSWQTLDRSSEALVALGQLPPHYRRVVELVDIGGLAYKEAADELGCPLGTVMSRLSRARGLLREALSA